jgi:hypothetical protein
MSMSERDVNQKVAEEICDRFRLNGQEFRLGECVALHDGKVVAVEKDLASAVRALRALDSKSKRGMVFEVGQLVDIIRWPLAVLAQ